MGKIEYEELRKYLGEDELKGLEGDISKLEIGDGAVIVITSGVKTIIPRPDFYDGPDY